MNASVFSNGFVPALQDYLYLMERGFPVRQSLSLVADRYRLNSTQRVVLYRGADSHAASTGRASKRAESAKGRTLSVDLFNVLFTVSNYLYGRTLFISTDGFLRDNGEEFAKQEPGSVLERAAGFFFRRLVETEPSQVLLYVDTAYENSEEIIELVSHRLSAVPEPVRIMQRTNSDHDLMHITEGVVATADSVIIDSIEVPVIDAALGIVRADFSAEIPGSERDRRSPLQSILSSAKRKQLMT